MTDPLSQLEDEVRRDLARIAHPRQPWLTPKTAPDGTEALDVLVVGAGQGGIATAFGLKRAKVDNVLVIDMAEAGREGPWRTFARMPTLRSPKDYTGPDLEVPSLTYEAWHTARFGADHWQALDLIGREEWAGYLDWVRRMTGARVRNGVELIGIDEAGPLLRATVREAGATRDIHTRRIVLATGQESGGSWHLPPAVEALPAHLRAHTCEDIDFAALEGKTVFVLGAGASAFDNAATALEAGAVVHLFTRRDKVQVIQPYRAITFAGFMRHLADLDDALRWKIMRHVLSLREGFPQHTYDRCARHDTFQLHVGAPWLSARADGDRVVIETPRGTMEGDYVIAGTGIDMDYAARPEFARFGSNIASWADRYQPPVEDADERLGRYPYLNDDFSFAEKHPGETPWISRVHLFAIAATMSFGPSGSSINAMTTAVPRLVSGITRGLFREDAPGFYEELLKYEVPQAVVPEADVIDHRRVKA
ncbi:NAD(P)-binding domain-containing protein [Acuticoccus sediminis]|uniref:NAD(P)-binding domain-containing protein n=1 Tax=Acuticoccus sediminis TaxID=2184697 RepID=UPI001CFEB388|nr:NAD(P)/FAD-dependent oxidoreductase [Acuticoccus sediminis]